MTGVVRSFLPWFRAGLATALDEPPPPGAARAAVPASLRLRAAPSLGQLDIPVDLAGPGDVIGLDHREILRTEPYDGCPAFEPSYFPYVELASPDLPWRFTPFRPATEPLPDPEAGGSGPPVAREQQRLQPWIALVVVPADPAAVTPAGKDGGLAVLACDASDLPDLTEAWAWAHVQVTHDQDQPVEEAVGDSSRTIARLVCPRRLEAGVRYLACLVPTFAAVKAALLPGGPAVDPLAPAWGADGAVQLPAYLYWSFTTGPAGSFEALVRRLRPRPAPEAASGRPIATGAPGWGAASSSPGSTVVMQGALRPIGVAEPEADDATLAASLRAAVSRSGTGVELRPPLYGQDYQGGAAAIAPGAGGWLAGLNTDPRRRVAAGLGAWAVAVHQEELADQAWRQLGQRAPGDPDLASAVAGSLVDRHQVAAVVPPAMTRLLRLGGPLAGGVSPEGSAAALRDLDPAPDLPGGGQPTATAAPAPAPAERFAPRFDQPAYAFLRAVAEEWLLPAAGDVPADSVVLVQTNGAFVESFLVGLNHALARELVWRRYPLDVTGTFFDRFWAAAADQEGSATPTKVPPIASWSREDPLGSHGAGGDHLVLLVRGELLRRFPTAAVYLAHTGPDGAEHTLLPYLSGTIGADAVFVGFPLTPRQALEPGPSGPGASTWSVVIQEALDHARFGCDDPPEDGATTAMASWRDLDWSHPQVAGHSHVPVAGPLLGVERPLSGGAGPTAVWGLDAAHQALATQQPAFRIRIPVALWLEPLLPPPPRS